MKIVKNIGNIDKKLRLVIGFLLIVYGVYFNSWVGFIALVPILTATMNICPLYSLLGLSTCPMEKHA